MCIDSRVTCKSQFLTQLSSDLFEFSILIVSTINSPRGIVLKKCKWIIYRDHFDVHWIVSRARRQAWLLKKQARRGAETLLANVQQQLNFGPWQTFLCTTDSNCSISLSLVPFGIFATSIYSQYMHERCLFTIQRDSSRYWTREECHLYLHRCRRRIIARHIRVGKDT